MKKLLALLTAALMLAGIFCLTVVAESEDQVTAYVTIANGSLVVAQEKITVTDTDGDGKLTISDALYLAHEKKYTDGASGYCTDNGTYGLYVTKLWGVSNGGSYGFYVNNVSAMGISDSVKNGDFVYAFIYTDMSAYSDTYSYFNVNSVSAKKGDTITLTLLSSGYDENWNPVTKPVEGAALTLGGKDTGVVTDAQGKASLTLDESGTLVISAKSDTQTLVPPVCTATVKSDNSALPYIAVAAAAAIIVAAITTKTKKKNA